MNGQAHDKDRGENRRKWDVEVQVTPPGGGQGVECRALDISENGVRIASPVPFEPAAFVMLALHLPGVPGMFDLHGQIRWCETREKDFLLGVAIDLASAEVSHAQPHGFWARLFGI
ncbi:MAG: PilZ domain-containing protein [Halothiobacillaceae bacterium]|jgi:hypothetical protein|nr:MAG: PilZ domain-containing protein [Halothiobacillaceae bacterium]